MPKINFRWDWEADKPSRIHCGVCGFLVTITPSTAEVKDGFVWHCLKCGSKYIHGDPKPVEPIRENPPVDTPVAEKDNGLGYPQTKRLFERTMIGEWLGLMVGDVFYPQKVSTIGAKFKAAYKKEFGKPPVKDRQFNTYSGVELNTIIARMFEGADRPLIEELQELYLEKMRERIVKGAIVFGSSGMAREVEEVADGWFVFVDPKSGEHRRAKSAAAISVIHPDSTKNF